jgi:hypothetical protein
MLSSGIKYQRISMCHLLRTSLKQGITNSIPSSDHIWTLFSNSYPLKILPIILSVDCGHDNGLVTYYTYEYNHSWWVSPVGPLPCTSVSSVWFYLLLILYLFIFCLYYIIHYIIFCIILCNVCNNECVLIMVWLIKL